MVLPPDSPAPGSDEAIELLEELVCIYGFNLGKLNGHKHDPLSPVVAGFVAVLTLPLYRDLDLQPQFLAQTLRPTPTPTHRPSPIRQYADDLRYYMIISLDSASVGSIVWSIFWQPDVECNVVSPWLSSTLDVLRPCIDAGELDILAKAFALRNPRVAFWWLGMFLLGSPAISSLVVRYLETLQERWGDGTMGWPDPTVSS